MKRGFADTPNGQIHYWEEPGPSGLSGLTPEEVQTLVLLHLTPDPRSFLPAMPFLGEHFRTIAIDLPGYGDSQRPPQPYTEIAEFADAVLAACDGIGLERFHLLGHMTGANIAAEIAARAPDRIRRLVLSELFDWQGHAMAGVHSKRFPAPAPVADGSHLIAIWNQYSGMLGEVSMDDVQRRFYVLYQAIYNGPSAGGEIYGAGGWATAAPYTIERQPLVERLPAIAAPTLILCAGQGILRSGADPRIDRDRLTALLPNGRSQTVDDISHLAPFVAPARFAEVVTVFLRETTRR
jgi:pimeloyl-ACP methyl ester carboxylesterase